MIKDTLVKTSEQLHQLQGHAHPNMFLNVLSSLAMFFSPVAGVFLAVGMFVILDTFLGRWKAKNILPEGSSSKLLRKGLFSKTALYLGFMIAFYLLDFYIVNQFLKAKTGWDFLMTKMMAVLLIYVEVDSMDENIKKVKGYGLKHYFKKIISTIKYALEEVKSVKDLFSKK